MPSREKREKLWFLEPKLFYFCSPGLRHRDRRCHKKAKAQNAYSFWQTGLSANFSLIKPTFVVTPVLPFQLNLRLFRMRHIAMPKRYIWIFILFLPLACSTETGPQQKVVGVMDGDTIEILEEKRTTRVRLYGVDAPEKNQDYGSRARQFTSDLVFGKNVQLIEKGKDRYGRVIGIVMLPDGRSLNEELVRNGFAWYYRDYAKDPVLEQLEADARQDRRGLWEMPEPIAPWDFRKERRSGTVASAKPKPKPAQAPTPRYGPAKAAAKVFICDSKGATSYHTSRTCSSLKRCKSEIKQIPLQAALDAGRQPDKVCVGSLPN